MIMFKRIWITVSIIIFTFYSLEKSYALEASAGFGFMYYTWKEHTSVGKVDESGFMPTIQANLSGAPLGEHPWRLGFDSQLFYGQVDYDTKTLSGTPVDTNSDYWGFRFGPRTGWRFGSETGYVEPFLGLTFAIWEREIKSTALALGYPELYTILYHNVGVQTRVGLTPQVSAGLSFSLDPMLWAREKIDWSGISNEELVVKNGRRLGWTVAGNVHWQKLEFKAYWQAIRFGGSNLVSCLGTSTCRQPRSEQDMIGFQVGYLF